jgi:hypothetical protein
MGVEFRILGSIEVGDGDQRDGSLAVWQVDGHMP